MERPKAVEPVTTLPIPPYLRVCDPWPLKTNEYVQPASRYYATGGAHPRQIHTHDWLGVDTSGQIYIPNAPTDWGPTFQVGMWHTSDWVVYHFRTGKIVLNRIQLCLQNPKNPTKVGTPVELWFKKAQPLYPPPHDSDLPGAEKDWHLMGTVLIDYRDWKMYELKKPTDMVAEEWLTGVRLQQGEIGPEPGTDRNVYIAWIKIGV